MTWLGLVMKGHPPRIGAGQTGSRMPPRDCVCRPLLGQQLAAEPRGHTLLLLAGGARWPGKGLGEGAGLRTMAVMLMADAARGLP